MAHCHPTKSHRRLASEEPGCTDALTRVLLESAGGEAALLPPTDFEAALHFLAGQLSLLSRLNRRRYEQLHQPYSLARFVELHPEAAGACLAGQCHLCWLVWAVAGAILQHFGWLPIRLLLPLIGAAGAVLQQHPRGFLEHAAPWLRQALGWGDAELAAAALSPSFSQLCRLDAQQAQRWVRGGCEVLSVGGHVAPYKSCTAARPTEAAHQSTF